MLRPGLLLFAHSLCALSLCAQEVPLFTKDFPPEEFRERRAALMKNLGSNAFAVIQGAPASPGYTRFRQSNDFYYLCGVESPHAYLLLDPSRNRTVLYLPHRDPGKENSGGKILHADDPAEVRKLTGVETVAPIEQLAADLARIGYGRPNLQHLFTPLAPAEGLAVSRDIAYISAAEAFNDPWDGRPSREGRFVQLLRERLPRFEIHDLSPLLDALREIKSPRELSLITRATRLAGESMLEGMRSTAPGQSEYEIDGLAKFIYFRNGAQGEAYNSLVASGVNTYYPHYSAGKRKMDAGDLVLMDFAPDVAYYMSDVTRMWPASGKFSPTQRELYGFYQACYEEMLKAMKVNAAVKDVQQSSAAEMRKILAATTFSKPEYKRAAERFVESWTRSPFGLGHYVGLSTHDIGFVRDTLRPGLVFTIEPALVVPEEKIYIRLEDVIAVTADGIQILSDFVPRSIDAIEAEMKKPGLLKRVPRID